MSKNDFDGLLSQSFQSALTVAFAVPHCLISVLSAVTNVNKVQNHL